MRTASTASAKQISSAVLLSWLVCCHPTHANLTTPTQSSTTSVVAPCPTELTALFPRGITERALVRVRALFEHPTMGPLVQRALDAQSERVLLRRAERYGYDLRTLDRVAIGWAPDGTTLYFAQGAIDASTIADRLYSELMHPRSHAADAQRNERIEGPLREHHVALLSRPSCALVAYAEGPTGALVDRAMGTPRAHTQDPAPVFWWRTQRRVQDVPPSGAALLRYVEQIEIEGNLVDQGVGVRLAFAGPLPPNAESVLRAAIAELASSPLGSLCGAEQWAAGQNLSITQSPEEIQVQLVLPWAAIRELLSAIQGRY